MANKKLVTLDVLKAILPAFEKNILNKVDEKSIKPVEPAQDDIPSFFIYGTMPTEKTYVPLELEYVSKTDSFRSYIYGKLQGTSTLAHPKKNFTIALFEDEARSVALNKNFKGWGKMNKFVLKADYIDITHARNVVCAKLWSKIVESRPDYNSLPEELRNSPNNGAIDGFPVKVYVNGAYQGLYALTIPKGALMFGMNENNPNHTLISAEMNDNGDSTLEFNPCNFNAFWDASEEYWNVEVGTLNDNIIESFNNIIDDLNNETNMIETHLDIQSVIDYYIFQDVILGTDGLAKNMLMATYDMTKWYLNAYDMDATFDLSWEGELLDAPDTEMPGAPYLNQYSALLQFIQINYTQQMIERYFELRKSVLSLASIIREFENYMNIYGEDLCIKDIVSYPDIPNANVNTLDRLKEFIAMRLEFLDKFYGGEL